MSKRILKIFGIIALGILLVKEVVYSNESASTNTDVPVYKINSDTLKCIVAPRYKYRFDGKPGRQILLSFNNDYFKGEGEIILDYGEYGKESSRINFEEGAKEVELLLPENIGVKSSSIINLTIKTKEQEFSKLLTIPAFRYWEVYIYPHSHVDIGYTNTHENVELIHTRNLINGLTLAKKTKNYPEGARYKWNPEVIWPVERYLNKATEEEKQLIFDGIKNGYLLLDAGYVNMNTSLATEEELFELFRQSKEYEKVTGKKIETFVQVDIPGMSWGIVPVAAKLGIKYCLTFNNGYDRVGHSVDLNFKPFWWEAPSGKEKILFLQAGSYSPGATAKGKYFWPKLAGETDPSKLFEIIKTDNPRENFVDNYLNEMLPKLEEADYYPYDIFPMSWAMADNTPIDADLPEAVRSWNEEFAYPKLKIVGSTEIMREFEIRYGKDLPVMKGDFTEYWTDGAGTAAKQTAQNRASKERLLQAETMWTMMRSGEPAPRNEFKEAWRNILMGGEHTWCYMNPSQEPINSEILQSKFAFFDNAQTQSLELLSKTLPLKGENCIAVFNNLSWDRGGIVSIPADQAEGYNCVTDLDGKPVNCQKLSTGELIFMTQNIPSFGSKKYLLSKGKYVSTKKMAKNNILDNGILHIEIDPESGDVVSLKLKGEEFACRESACAINSFRYLKGDDHPEKASFPKKVQMDIVENGPLLATIRVISDAEGCKSLSREITIYDGESNVDITNVIDKIATVNKEGIHFGFAFNVDDPVVAVDIPWGVMEIEKDQLPGANRNWIALQRWLDISNDIKGITWCPLDAPLFEVGKITANILGSATNSEKWITKLKPSSTIYSWALNNHWHTNFPLCQGGKITFRYSLQPHLNDFGYANANRFGMEKFQPLVATCVDESFKAGQLLSIEGSSAIYCTIFKTSSDGKSAILRLHSLSERDETIILKWIDRIPTSVSLYDINEEKELNKLGNRLTIPANDFVTLKIIW